MHSSGTIAQGLTPREKFSIFLHVMHIHAVTKYSTGVICQRSHSLQYRSIFLNVISEQQLTKLIGALVLRHYKTTKSGHFTFGFLQEKDCKCKYHWQFSETCTEQLRVQFCQASISTFTQFSALPRCTMLCQRYHVRCN